MLVHVRGSPNQWKCLFLLHICCFAVFAIAQDWLSANIREPRAYNWERPSTKIMVRSLYVCQLSVEGLLVAAFIVQIMWFSL